MLIHAGTNNVSSSQSKQLAADVIDLAESAIKLNPDIEVSVSGLIVTRNTEQTKSIRLANGVIKSTCDDKGWVYIDNSQINIHHLKSSSIHLNKVGVKLLASNFIRQALRSTGRSMGSYGNFPKSLWNLAKALNKSSNDYILTKMRSVQESICQRFLYRPSDKGARSV